MKRLIPLALLLCCLPPATARPAPPAVGPLDTADQSVVMLRATVATEWGKRTRYGTAVIVTRDGLAVTNAHVAGEFRSMTAVLRSGRRVTAKVLRSDPVGDLALLRLPTRPDGYRPMPFAKRRLRRGDTVWAIGNPCAQDWSVSRGVVAAFNRRVEYPPADLRNAIQHTAAISPGSSGGALLNERMELVGINCAMRDGGTLMGFAIPVRSVASFLAK